MRLHSVLVVLLLGLASSVEPQAHTRSADEVAPETKTLTDALKGLQFEPDAFNALWQNFYTKTAPMRDNEPESWLRALDTVLHAAVTSNATLALRTVLDIQKPGDGKRDPVFNPNRALYIVAKSRKVSEVEGAKMARMLLEYGASPTLTGLTKNPKYEHMSAVQIAIHRRRPSVVQAFLTAPSPVSYESLEAAEDRKAVEKFRTDLVREVFRVRRKEHLARAVLIRGGKKEGTKSERVVEAMKEAKVFVFAEKYLNVLALFLVFLVFILLLIFILYQVRIKRLPYADALMTAVQPGWWNALFYCTSTLACGSPVGGLFEVIGHGVGTGGAIFWSEDWTGRKDIALTLTLAVVIQTFVTVSTYLSYAPSAGEDGAAHLDGGQEAPLHRVMYYAKSKKDWGRVMNRSGIYMVAAAASFYILFAALEPMYKMFECPTKSIADTYGFDYSLTRTVAMMWDIVIFFVLTNRIFAVIDTVIVLKLIEKVNPLNKKEPEATQEEASVDN